MIDFLVIGAQKAGTTSLFKYLESCSGVCMPPEKEAPFFCVDDRFERGLDWYLDEFFAHRKPGQKLGTVTPQYLCDPRAAERIYRTVPLVRLIAILRNPIDRAVSHYKMAVRRGIEQREISQAFEYQLRPERVIEARSRKADESSESHCYIAWGEYGRLLDLYLRWFDRSQLLVLFSDELAENPTRVVRLVQDHIELKGASLSTEQVGKRYNVGADRTKLPFLELRKLRRMAGPLRRIWRIVPRRHRRTLMYWYEQWNVAAQSEPIVIEEHTRERLVRHFCDDLRRLDEIVAVRPPWSEFEETTLADPN